jgi:AcrR family transcriptional regulator
MMKNPLETQSGQESQKSGQEVAKNSGAVVTTHGAFAKLKRRIQQNTRTYFGKANAAQYLIRIQCRRRREWFELGNDLDAAVKQAREIDQFVRLHGWEETRRKYKPAFAAERSELTVGRFIELVEQHGQLDPSTAYTYAARLRRIVSGIRRIKLGGSDKFSGGPTPSKWRVTVDGTLLNTITPEQVANWRDAYVGRFPVGSAERTHAEHTVNGILRNARALFAKRVLKRVLSKVSNLVLPAPLPFDGVEFIAERESDYFYTSEVDVKQLIEDGFKELSGNQLVIFVLAIGAGLRRNEIDKLPWAHVDLPTGTVTVAPTRYGRLKSDSSVGKIQLEPRFADVLRKHASDNRGEFVLPSHVAPRVGSLQRHYRCKKDFKALCQWQSLEENEQREHRVGETIGFPQSNGLRCVAKFLDGTDQSVKNVTMRTGKLSKKSSGSFIERARRRQIIDCAIESLAQEGYVGASLATVARRAGVSKGVILYHFRSKDALVETAVEEIFRELVEFIVPRMQAQQNARARLKAFIQSQLTFLEQHRSHLLAVSYILVNHRNSRGEFYLRTKAEADAQAAISAILEEGQSSGEFRAFALRPMATTILNAINGALSQWVSDPNLSLGDYAEELVTTFDLATKKGPRAGSA